MIRKLLCALMMALMATPLMAQNAPETKSVDWCYELENNEVQISKILQEAQELVELEVIGDDDTDEEAMKVDVKTLEDGTVRIITRIGGKELAGKGNLKKSSDVWRHYYPDLDKLKDHDAIVRPAKLNWLLPKKITKTKLEKVETVPTPNTESSDVSLAEAKVKLAKAELALAKAEYEAAKARAEATKESE
ncbi:hypothetical protein OAU50_04870 [Planctomycetota bacterium]|nr:hypothetical protein [Planctomycetota bacterium]